MFKNFLCFIIFLSIISTIISLPIELSNYYETELQKGTSLYFHLYHENIFIGNAPYFFIKFTDYQKVNLKVYLNETEASFTIPKEKEKWISFNIRKIIGFYCCSISDIVNIFLKIDTTENNIKMLFIEPSKTLKMNLKQFLSLNFITDKLIEKPFPLLLDINVEKNVSFAFKEEINYSAYDKNTIYNIEKNNFYKYEGLDETNLRKENNIFRFKISPYIDKNYFNFHKIKFLYYMEKIYTKNNTFQINNVIENNYLVLNTQNYRNISFYINDNSGSFHQYYSMALLSQKMFDNFYDNINTIQFQQVINGKVNYMDNQINEDYLIISINNKSSKNEGFILFFNEILEINGRDGSNDIIKGTHALIYIHLKLFTNSFLLLSSSKNMKILDSNSNDEFTNKIIKKKEKEDILYIDSSHENTKFFHNYLYIGHNVQFILDNDIKKFLNMSDNFYIREIFNKAKNKFFSYYFFDIDEIYYIYTKKYFGNSNLYKYKQYIDKHTPAQKFTKPISYYDEKIYDIVNNQLLILNGTQFFNYYINFGTFFDFYIQKVNDSNYIELNKDINKSSNNTVKLLNGMKKYFINFELNHLIKLDNDFLEAEVIFIDNIGTKYILNRTNKIINLKGNNFTVESNKNALIYFYEKIQDFDNKIIFEFDKNNSGKNQKINITNKNQDNKLKIAVAKDFGFKNCYPMINSQDLDILTIPPNETITLYFENHYDLLELNLSESEGEKYYIYLFEIQKGNEIILLDKNKIDISQPLYFNSLTKYSKLNYDIIPKGKSNLILNLPDDIYKINYHFIKCSNNKINFGINKEKKEINTNTFLSKKIYNKFQTVIHSFESNDEFLFVYDFSKIGPYDSHRADNYGIEYLNKNNKNIFTIGFSPIYLSFTEYYIIIAKKNDINNLYSFSNPCYLTKLIINNSNDICYKKIYYSFDQNFIFEEIDINKLIQDDNDNDEYIINIISNNLVFFNHLDLYTPLIYNKKNKIKESTKLKFFDKIFLKPNKNYFVYEHLSNDKLIFQIENFCQCNIYSKITKNNDIIDEFYSEECSYQEIIFKEKGIYFIEFFNIDNPHIKNKYFLLSYAFNILIEEIDLTKNIYSGYFTNRVLSSSIDNNNLPYYKVINLKEDRLVYFTYTKYLIDDPYTPFMICVNKKDQCVNNIISYNFLKGKEYTIYINKIKSSKKETIINYSFFPIFQNTIEHIVEGGYYNINTPKIFFIEKNKVFYFDVFNIKIYFISNNRIIKIDSLLKLKYKKIHNINICSFFIEKDFIFRNIIFIPEDNDKLKQIFITKERLSLDSDHIKVKAGINSLIDIEYYLFNKYAERLFGNKYGITLFKNYLLTFSSPIENIRFVSLESNNRNKKFIYGYFWEQYLYIDKNDDIDIYIDKNIYEQNDIFFSILYGDTINDFFKSKNYFNKRLNTNAFPINYFINLYINKFNTTYNLYIKKYYGSIQLYESQYILNNFTKNIDSILLKPINNLKEKNNVFNKLIQLNKNQIITGYLSGNSLLDIYIEKDNNNSDIYLNDFKNRKYLKKGIEYKIHFNLNHLIKLEQPQINTEIIIYNNDNKIILNQKNQTGVVIGKNFKIKSNENAMIYFYPKTKKFQKKIDPKIDEIVEIKTHPKGILHFSIDFGFEGFEPPNMEEDYYENILYLENIYNKLEINLTQGEYLYIYYDTNREDILELNYIKNKIILSDYKYNFILMKKDNLSVNQYIIPNLKRRKINLQINHCNNNWPIYKYKIKINFENSKTEEYSGKILNLSYYLDFLGKPFYRFSFESEDNFILTYTESGDDIIPNNRIKYDNSTINDITIINEKKININFNTNYKNSLTKYIIMITPDEKNNTFENLKNFCFLTELINKKQENFIAEEIYDIGENDFISIDIDISKLSCENKNCTVNIISQELRYEQFLNFYEPKFFYIEKNITVYTKKNILLILGIILLLTLVYFYYKQTNRKRNNKKYGNNKIEITNEMNLGTELNDSSDFLKNKINN